MERQPLMMKDLIKMSFEDPLLFEDRGTIELERKQSFNARSFFRYYVASCFGMDTIAEVKGAH